MKRIFKFGLVCVSVLLAGCGGGSGSGDGAPTATRYVITDLGQNFTSSQAYSLNNLGQVVGTGNTRYIGSVQPNSSVTPGQEQTTSFVYADGKVANLQSNGAFAINDSGQIVVGGGVYQNNAYAPVPSLAHSSTPGTTFYAEVTAINNQGQVVGSSSVDSAVPGTSLTHAILYSNGQLTDLGTLNGVISRATAINNQGQIVGSATTPAPQSHARQHSLRACLPLAKRPDNRPECLEQRLQ